MQITKAEIIFSAIPELSYNLTGVPYAGIIRMVMPG